MQAITVENNHSEKAFTVREGGRWRPHWFTLGREIGLCGHATLGTAFVCRTEGAPLRLRHAERRAGLRKAR